MEQYQNQKETRQGDIRSEREQSRLRGEVTSRKIPRIIVDTREQKPWDFELHETTRAKLDVGDYSLEGMEHLICIERKASLVDFAQSIISERFERELRRMTHKYRYLILDFDFDDMIRYPDTLPGFKNKDKIKITGKFLMRRLFELQLKYKFVPLFVGAYGAESVLSLFRRILNET